MYQLCGCCLPMACKWQYNFSLILSRHRTLTSCLLFSWWITIMPRWMQFMQHSLSASMYSIASGICSEQSELISIPRNFWCYGCLSTSGFVSSMTTNSMLVGLRSKRILRSSKVLLSIFPSNGFPKRRCGLQCHGKIALYLRRVTLTCCWNHML